MKRPTCPICSTRKWRKDRDSGGLICINGHVLEGYQVTEGEDDDTGMRGTSRRKKQKRRRNKEKADKFYGAKGRYLAHVCFQMVLRKQTDDLVQLWKLPREFELVVRDLWTIYMNEVQLVKLQIDEPIPKQKEAIDEVIDEEIMEAEAYFTEASTDVELAETPSAETKDELGGIKRHLYLYYSLVFLYLACVRIKIPVLLVDLCNLAQEGCILFFGSLTWLPSKLTSRMDRTDTFWLEKGSLPILRKIGKTVENFVALYASFGITFPAISAPHLFLRHMKNLLVPISLLKPALNILHMLGDSMELKPHLGQRSRRRDFLPEVRSLAVLLVLLRMVYGMDGSGRLVPSKLNLPDMEDWVAILKRKAASNKMPENTNDLLALQPSEMDAFITYCDKALLITEDPQRKIVADALYTTAETTEEPASSDLEWLHEMYGQDAITHEYISSGPLKAGEHYSHLPFDSIGLYPGCLEEQGTWTFWLDHAGKEVGLSIVEMAEAVSRTEQDLIKFAKTLK